MDIGFWSPLVSVPLTLQCRRSRRSQLHVSTTHCGYLMYTYRTKIHPLHHYTTLNHTKQYFTLPQAVCLLNPSMCALVPPAVLASSGYFPSSIVYLCCMPCSNIMQQKCQPTPRPFVCVTWDVPCTPSLPISYEIHIKHKQLTHNSSHPS